MRFILENFERFLPVVDAMVFEVVGKVGLVVCLKVAGCVDRFVVIVSLTVAVVGGVLVSIS